MNVKPPTMRLCYYCGAEHCKQGNFCKKQCRLLWEKHPVPLDKPHHYMTYKQDLISKCTCGGSVGVTEEGKYMFMVCFECDKRGNKYLNGSTSAIEKRVIREWNEGKGY